MFRDEVRCGGQLAYHVLLMSADAMMAAGQRRPGAERSRRGGAAWERRAAKVVVGSSVCTRGLMSFRLLVLVRFGADLCRH